MNPLDFMPSPPINKSSIHLERYKRFIETRRSREPPSGYMEKHHIIPKAFGTHKTFTSQDWNKIMLSAREHYIAHFLLWKAYGNKMTAAFWKMNQSNPNKTSRMYEKLRMEFSAYASEINMGHLGLKGSLHPNYGRSTPENVKDKIRQSVKKAAASIRHDYYRGHSHTEASKQKTSLKTKGTLNPMFGVTSIFITNGIDSKRISRNEIIPEGWRRGVIRRKGKDSGQS